jgi:uncharacterized coiled-coil protein SlyX
MSGHEMGLEARNRELEKALAARDALIQAHEATIAAQNNNLVDLRQAMKLLEGPPKRRWRLFGR